MQMYTHEIVERGTNRLLSDVLAGLSESQIVRANRLAGHAGKRGNYSQPFSTISAAINAALSGDTVVVEPGTYNERVTPKNGVNIYARDAIINYTGTDDAALFIDNAQGANGPVTCTVFGGTWKHSGTPSANSNHHAVFAVTNANSSLTLIGVQEVGNNCASGPNRAALYMSAGTVRAYNCGRFYSGPYDGVILEGSPNVILQIQDVEGAVDGVSASGDGFELNLSGGTILIDAQNIKSSGDSVSTGIHYSPLTGTGRTQIRCQSLTGPNSLTSDGLSDTSYLHLSSEYASGLATIQNTGTYRFGYITNANAVIDIVDNGERIVIVDSEVVATGTNKDAITCAADLRLRNCILRATGTGKSISGSGNVYAMGVYANLATSGITDVLTGVVVNTGV